MENTYKSVWDNLSQIDLTGKTEVKNGFTYLANAFGVAEMNKHYPQHHVTWGVPKTFEDGTVEIYCKVSIDNLYKEMWYPVTNYANKPIPNPSSFDMNSAKMRCLMKCYAIGFGLGIQIFLNGETKPEEVKKTDPVLKDISKSKDKINEITKQLKNGGLKDGNTNEVEFAKIL
jgi:hypothetical protein|tara:strand:- start:611 stop:1129 length:519 start_codon:yes stop_codon:yes gene_type:complete